MRRAFLFAVVGLGLVPLTANAKVIFVNTTFDVIDYGPACSLRDAVRSANTDTPKGGCNPGVGDDEIVLPAGTYTISRAGAGEEVSATGDYDVLGAGSLAVYGHPDGGTTINAAGIDRAFEASVPLTLRDLTITGGNPGHGNTWPLDGGAIRALAGLTLERVRLEGNRTAAGDETGVPPHPDPGGSGGAVSVNGTLVVRDSVFRDNHTGGGGNATGASGGGNGGSGGAIALFGDTSTIERTRFEGNSTGRGGAQSNVAGSYAGAGGAGGALFLGGPTTLRNIVIIDNVTGGRGAGADQTGYTPPGALSIGEEVVSLFNVTLARNTADPGVPTALGTTPQNGTINVTASIVDGSCGSGLPPIPFQPSSIVDGGDNLTRAGSGCPGTVGDADIDADAIPAADSPAIDTMTTACPAVDARGVSRPQGATCDIGAVERGPSTLIVAPSSLAFPGVALGALSEPLPVTLDYTGDGSFALRDITTSGEFQATGCAGVLQTAGTCSIEVRFAPTTAGVRSGTLTLATPLGLREVALTGTGLSVDGPGDGPGGGPGPQGCGPRAATLVSIGCRLRVLADDVNGASNLANFQQGLAKLLGKARSKQIAAETLVAGPKPKKGKRALKVVLRKLNAFSRTLRSRSARQTLDAAMRKPLIERAVEVVEDVRAVVRTIK